MQITLTTTNNLIITGDLNELPTSDFESVLDMIQMVQVPIRGNKIFIESKMQDCYNFMIKA